jgi:hypothetical protein
MERLRTILFPLLSVLTVGGGEETIFNEQARLFVSVCERGVRFSPFPHRTLTRRRSSQEDARFYGKPTCPSVSGKDGAYVWLEDPSKGKREI